MKSGVISVGTLMVAGILHAQAPQVPSRLEVAGIDLKINDAARQIIQEDVDALTQSQTYFTPKVERAKMYFPIIEKILTEERVPDEFKYLVVQESALIPDAVSTSNAVGFWQFKDFTAAEMGLRVDSKVDERMNIVSSTRAAARYLKKNNFFFDNWILALQSYQMGAGGVMQNESDKYFGAKDMAITKKTHWYVLKYLSHFVAFQDALSRDVKVEFQLMEYYLGGGNTLHEVAVEAGVNEDNVMDFNVWLKKGRIPLDKTYAVILPYMDRKSELLAMKDLGPVKPELTPDALRYKGIESPMEFPDISDSKGLFNKKGSHIWVNGIPGLIGVENMEVKKAAVSAGISEAQFRKYNELFPHDGILEGQPYYFKPKKRKAKAHYHTVQNGQTLWTISQKYGVKSSKLLTKNRLKSAKDLKPGMVLYLRYIRPSGEPVVYREIFPEDKVKSDPIVFSTAPLGDEYIKKSGIMEIPEPEKNHRIINHVIQPKETLYSIGKTYNVSVMAIAELNDLDISDGLKAGDTLNIPIPESAILQPREVANSGQAVELDSEEFQEYVVKPGDTLYSIARAFNVTIEDIQSWNQKIGVDLKVGESLKLKKL